MESSDDKLFTSGAAFWKTNFQLGQGRTEVEKVKALARGLHRLKITSNGRTYNYSAKQKLSNITNRDGGEAGVN